MIDTVAAPMTDTVIRAAMPSDVAELEALIAASARALGRGFYSDAETEAAIAHVFGVDRALVADGTYLVAEVDGDLAGCGGWSRRRTLFGGDHYAVRDDSRLDPAVEPARIRAMFVDARFARRGVGTAILAAGERAAADAGFTRLALMATLPGVPFYATHGYRAEAATVLDLGGVPIRFVPMSKAVVAKVQQ